MCLIKFILGLGLFVLVFLLVSAFGLLRGIKRMAGRQNTGEERGRSSDATTHNRSNGNDDGKIFEDSEGEYVEFEEIKDDQKS